jgi:hypothetical protein
MRDYWFTQELLKAAGFGYLAVCVIALGLALWLPKRGWVKALMATMVLGIASVLPFIAVQEKKQEQVQVDDYKKRYNEAKAVFDEKCKSAGEKIYKTVDNVEGILLMNVRKNHYIQGSYDSKQDPNWPDAGLPFEPGGDEYITTFLGWEHKHEKDAGRGYINTRSKDSFSKGFDYVDVVREEGAIKRYRLVNDELLEEKVGGKATQYAVRFENFSDIEARRHWIAGTKISIQNVRTKELLAEKVAYAFEPGFGSTEGHRQPWLFAVTCSEFNQQRTRATTRFFVDNVLKPIQERK